MVDCASVFVTRSTDRGMCCTFNQAKADEIFKNSKYRDISSGLQEQDKQLGFFHTDSTNRYNLLQRIRTD